MPILETLGMQAASNVINGATGAVFGAMNDKRQIKQQERLNKQQMAYDKEMSGYNQQKQLELWEATGYGAQKKQLEEAGLNPALIYGQSGGGGMTAAANVSNGNAPEAPKGGGELLGMMQAQNLAMQAAQIENLKANTEKVKADTTKTKGVDTQLAGAQAQSLIQGVENQIAVKKLTEAQTIMQTMQNEITDGSIEQQINEITMRSKHAEQIVEAARYSNYINSQTMQDKITIIRAEAVGILIRNELTKAQKDVAESTISVNKATIDKIGNEIAQGWKRLSIEEFKALIERDFKGISQVMGNQLQALFEGINDLIEENTKPPFRSGKRPLGYKGEEIKY
jgi:hypothetical protein